MKNNRAVIPIVFALISSLIIISVPITPVTASPGMIYVPDDYTTIQAAINNANPGDTIIVAAGTYDEQVVVNKSLTLQGEGNTTIIEPSAPANLTKIESAPWIGGGTKDMTSILWADVAGGNVMVKDLKIDGINIDSAPPSLPSGGRIAGIAYIETSGLVENVTVINMHTSTMTPRSVGIWASADTNTSSVEVTNCTVQNYNRGGIYTCGDNLTANLNQNAISGPGVSGTQVPNGIFFLAGSTGTATFNTITACGYSGDQWRGTGIGTYNAGTNVTIGHNTIYDVQNAFAIHGGSDVTVEFNIVYECHTGVRIESGATQTTIQSNDIKNNTYAIRCGDAMGTNNVAHYNNFVGNNGSDPDFPDYVGAVSNINQTIEFDARFNWWGDPTGPYHPTQNPGGLGDSVSDYVNFDYYLDSPFGAILYMDPDPVQKAPGDVDSFFNVTVKIKNVTDLFGFDLNITWDNTLITFNHCYYNKTLDVLWGVGNWYVAKEATGSGGGTGWYKLAAVSTDKGFNATDGETMFKLEFNVTTSGCNFPLETLIHFETVKLSNSHWASIPAAVDDGLYQISATVPDLELKLVGGDDLEYCDTFEVEINVTHICANLKDYNFTIHYNSSLIEFVDVDYWGVLGNETHGNANYTLLEPGRIRVWDTGDETWTGESGLLFALTFHVKFDDSLEHIWRTCTPHDLTAQVWFEYAELSFEEGIIYMDGITMPSPLDLTINLIRGDIDCDGDVDIFDLRTAAAYYDESAPEKYDLNCDGIIDIFDLVIMATNYNYGT